MKNTFKEYHQFTDEEFKQLWENCLFVFDTNTLLNMYRYSRETVNIYFDVLKKLNKKRQLWIPYQVGFEFYKNRINVISEYEKSYDEILSILENAKNDIENKYKNHPFLDLKEIKEKVKRGVLGAEKIIQKAKKDHPNWIEKDGVLEQINELFKGSVGNNYNKKKLDEIKKEGEKRYEKKIPPGFKDNKKSEDERFGDLILWYQIIDKAKESKKPIVFISGDVKEDWWLEKDGKRLMPLPQLKKEIFDEAGVDFHIYTADRFLELNKDDIKKETIREVRKIRELEEKRIIIRRIERREKELNPKMFEKYSMEYVHMLKKLEHLIMEINDLEIHHGFRDDLEYSFHEIKSLRNRIMHGENDRKSFDRLYRCIKDISLIFDGIIHSEEIHPELIMKIRKYSNGLEYLNNRLRRFT